MIRKSVLPGYTQAAKFKHGGSKLPKAQVGKQSWMTPIPKNAVESSSTTLYNPAEKRTVSTGSTGYGSNLAAKIGNRLREEDTTGEEILELLDPTGISAYDDVFRVFENPDANWFDKTMITLSAVPIIGKAGKVAKAVKTASKPTTKIGKATKAISNATRSVANSKVVKGIEGGLQPVKYFDRSISPISRGVEGFTQRAFSRVPAGVANTTNILNRGRRFWTGVDLGLNAVPPPEKQDGGDIYNNLNPIDMYFYATGGMPNNPGFNALPDYVQKKIIDNMMYGGTRLKRYQGDEDGSTVDDSEEEYLPVTDEETYYPTNPDSYAPSVQDMIAAAAFTQQQAAPPNYGMVGPQMPAAYSAQAATPAAAAPAQRYNGVSIVDYMNQAGFGASDFATRKEIAKSLGIKNYRGTAQQNLQMLAALQNIPNAQQQFGTKKSGSNKSGGKKTTGQSGAGLTAEEIAMYNEMEGRKNPYVAINPATGQVYAFDNAQTDAAAMEEEPGTSYLPYLGAAAGLGALGYGAYRMFRGKPGVPGSGAIPMGYPSQKLLPSSEMAAASQFRSNVDAGKQILSEINTKGFYTADDIRALKNVGYKNASIEKMMSQFPKGNAQQVADFAKNVKNAVSSGKKASSFGMGSRAMNAVREGVAAARATPWLKYLRNIRFEDGGSTYSAGSFYDMGGGYPYGGDVYGQMMANGQLPQYMYGMGMQEGGSAEEMYVTPEEMEMLRQQGYDFDIIG